MLAALFLAVLSLLPQQKALVPGQSTLQGIVLDATTQQPIAGARVWIVDVGLTAMSGADGRFQFDYLPSGVFTITVSQIGYIFVKRTIDLPEKSTLGIVIALAEGQGTYTENVTVTAGPERPTTPGVGAQTVIGSGGLQSLRSVATDDPLRAAQALPGATTGDDFRSEFSVRGATYRQMGIVIDDIATPLLLHEVRGHDDTGSVAMINTDILDSVALTAGAEPQKDGAWLGGQLKFTIREGSRDRTQLRIAASDTGANAVVEGPLGGSRRGSWLFSARKSYAAWLIRKIDPGYGSTLGFYDLQTKWVYDLTSRQQLQFVAIGGDADYFQQNTGTANGLHTANSRSLVGSLVWRYLRPTFQASQRVSAAYSDFINRGLLGQNQGDGHTTSVIARTDVTWLPSERLTAEAGFQREKTHDQRVLRDYTLVNSSTVKLRSEDPYGGDRVLSSAYAQATAKTGIGAFIVGARGLTDDAGKTPYAAWWALGESPVGTRVTVRAGISRAVQYPDLYHTFYAPTPLVPERAMHYDLSADIKLTETVSARVNAYRRTEADILRSYNHEPRLVNGKLVAATIPQFRNSLTGLSRGAEFMLQRKAPTGLVGWISYGYGRTSYTDNLTAERFDGDFDQRHTLNVFLEERLSYRTAISLKVRTGSSPPIPGYFSGSYDNLFVSDTRNQVRLPQYLRIDARANRTFTFNQKRLTLFVEVINLTGRANWGTAEGGVNTRTFAATNWTEKLIPWLPSIGILIEF